MKKIVTLLTLVIFSTGLVAFDAEARRMGGGKSFGKQRSLNQQAAPRPAQPPASAPSSAGGSKWGGALAGLAAGGLLAALFMGGAFEGLNMMDMLMFALLIGGVFFVMRMMRKPQATASPRPMQFSGLNANDNTPPIQSLDTTTASGTGRSQGNIPADFKVAPFLRNAKFSFIRLQAAHDAGDISDIREYTTPEMLAEISMDINEHGLNQEKTEVMSIDADLLDVETTDDLAIASVRFHGQLRQGSEGEAEDFDEIWHVQKDLNDAGSVWLLAGIQQVVVSDDA